MDFIKQILIQSTKFFKLLFMFFLFNVITDYFVAPIIWVLASYGNILVMWTSNLSLKKVPLAVF